MSQHPDPLLTALQRLAIQVERLRGSVDQLLNLARDHENRLRQTERWRNQLSPWIAAITFLAGAIMTIAVDRLWSGHAARLD